MDNFLKSQQFLSNDKNVRPSETSLKFVAKNPRLGIIISDLLSKGRILSNKSTVNVPVEETIIIENLTNENNMDTFSLLSFLYYTGSLTLGETTEKGVELKIPNNNARENYIHEISSIYNLLDQSHISILDNAIVEMFSGNLEPFVVFVRDKFLKILQGNDSVHSDESSLKSVFIISIIIALGKKSIRFTDLSEHSIEGTDVDLFLEYEDYPSIHIEFKNTQVQQIKGWYGKPWDKQNEYSKYIAETMDDKTLFSLELKFKDKCQYLNTIMNNISDKWKSVCEKVKANSQAILRKNLPEDKSLISYAVYRIGLEKVLWAKIE